MLSWPRSSPKYAVAHMRLTWNEDILSTMGNLYNRADTFPLLSESPRLDAVESPIQESESMLVRISVHSSHHLTGTRHLPKRFGR